MEAQWGSDPNWTRFRSTNGPRTYRPVRDLYILRGRGSLGFWGTFLVQLLLHLPRLAIVHLPRPHRVALVDLAVGFVTLPPRTCGYLGGVASTTLGRAAAWGGRRWMFDMEVIDYTTSTSFINFRICASSGNPVIYNNSVPVLRGRFFCASIAYLVTLQWYRSRCCLVMDSGCVHMEICGLLDWSMIWFHDLAAMVV